MDQSQADPDYRCTPAAKGLNSPRPNEKIKKCNPEERSQTSDNHGRHSQLGIPANMNETYHHIVEHENGKNGREDFEISS